MNTQDTQAFANFSHPPSPGNPGAEVNVRSATTSASAQRLLQEIGELRVKATGRDALLLRLGVVLMVLGPVLTVVGYGQSSQTSVLFNQNDAQIVATIGLTLAVVGVGLFLRYSLAEFLRFWMARLLYEQARHVNGAPAPGHRPQAGSEMTTGTN